MMCALWVMRSTTAFARRGRGTPSAFVLAGADHQGCREHRLGGLGRADEDDRRGNAARDRVRELPGRDRLRWPVKQVVQDLNRFLRGWAGYFRYGNSTVQFDQIIRHADRRLALLIAKRHQRPWRYGRQVLNARPDRYGLISLNGNHRRATTQPAVAHGTLNADGEERR
jgi:Group II intron, maturase-specific domain